MRIFFDVLHLYYLPQFLPIYRELLRRNLPGLDVMFVLYTQIDSAEMTQILKDTVAAEQLPAHWVGTLEQGLALYKTQQPAWIIFGKGYKYLDDLPAACKTAMVNHGAGIKSSHQNTDACRFNIRFTEGPYQLQQLKKHYPPGNYIDVGFAKLDPLFRNEPIAGALTLSALGLDPNKKTLLYAPTFYPSSIELFADDWPRQFSNYNLIVKPHFFTLSKTRYRAQQRKLARWKTADNVYVAGAAEYSLLPFFALADLLISDASTALFEFAALNKPVVWCDFLKLRWTYRGLFAFRHKRRMDQDILVYADISAHAPAYDQLLCVVERQLAHPQEHEKQRLAYAQLLLGRFDGRVSEQIVDSLLAYRR